MKNMLSSRKILLFVIVGIVIFSALMFVGDFSSTSELILNTEFGILSILFLTTLVNYTCRYFKMEFFLRKLGIVVPTLRSLYVFYSGFLMSLTPAKVGEVFKSYLFKKSDGIKMRRTVPVVFSERLTDLLGLVFLALIGVGSFVSHTYYVFIVLGILLFFIAAVTNDKIVFGLCKLFSGFPFIGKYVKYAKDAYKNAKVLLTPKNIIIATLISMFSWFFECLALYLLLQYYGVTISIQTAIFIFAFSSIAGSLLLVPGGLGVAEGSFVALLLLVGVPLTIASATTILIRVTTLWFGVALSLVALYLYKRSISGASK